MTPPISPRDTMYKFLLLSNITTVLFYELCMSFFAIVHLYVFNPLLNYEPVKPESLTAVKSPKLYNNWLF